MFAKGLLLLAVICAVGAPRTVAASTLRQCFQGLSNFVSEPIKKLKTAQAVTKRRATLERKFGKFGFYIKGTTEEFGQQGVPIDSVTLQALKIPSSLHGYYDPKTGKFDYSAAQKMELAADYVDKNATVVLSPNDYILEDGRMFQDFIKLLEQEPTTKLWIITAKTTQSAKLQDSIQHLPAQISSRIRISADQKETPIIWVRDAFIPQKNIPAIVQGDSPPNTEAAIVNGRVLLANTLAPSIPSTKLPFYLEGGDIVVGERDVFVGYMTVLENAYRLQISSRDMLNVLGTAFGKPITMIGSEKAAPDEHIDYGFAVTKNLRTGEDVFILGSHQMAIASLHKATAKSKNDANHIRNRLESMNLKSKLNNFQHRLDYQAEILQIAKEKSYPVLEVPRVGPAYSFFSPSAIFTYTNSIFVGKTAMMPTLGIDSIDDAATKAFESLGYSVIPVPFGKELFFCAGGVRCATAVLPGGVELRE